MYYEDVDWNWRANLFGYAFVTAPEARVYHVHSGSTRALPFDFKYRLVERNLLSTVAKNCEGRRAARIWKGRFGFHGRNVVRKHFRWASILIVIEAMLRSLDSYEKRRQVNRRRVVSDGVVFRFAQGELPHFDPRNYAPERTLSNLIAMYRRKALITGDDRWFKVAEIASAVEMTLGHGVFDPRDDLVEHRVERRRRLETEDVARLVGCRHPALHVVLERRRR